MALLLEVGNEAVVEMLKLMESLIDEIESFVVQLIFCQALLV